MTSQMTQLQKPALPPKPVKYRAPLPPTSSSSVSRVSPAVKKYRAPAPPTGHPPPPPPPPSSLSTVSTSLSAGKVTMRREPMQVLPSSIANYERCRMQSDVTTTTYDDVVGVANGPRPAVRVIEDVSSQHCELRNQSTSAVSVASDRVLSDNSSTADKNEEGSSDVVVTVKPIIHDVKLCPRNSTVLSAARQQRTVRSWRSTESIDRLITSASAANGVGGPATRSSFLDPSTSVSATSTSAGRRSVYIDLGEYQTLLKHGRQDAVYSLPQPHCYGDDTLRAVKLITEKYDTFKRRQMRAMSFRDAAAGGIKASRQQSYAEGDETTIAEDEGRLINDATENSNKSIERRQTETVMSTTSGPPSTLSRTVMSLSRSDLNSSSSLHDVACPLEVDVIDDADCGISRTDRMRIEMFYRSHETEVYVCSSLADLFVGSVRPGGAAGRWVHVHTGVPVWLLNSGRGRRRRQLIIVVAERRTGLPLWYDRITYLSNYAQGDDGDSSDDTSHMMRPSSNLSSAVRISMFNRRSAAAFLDRFHRFTADPVDDLWKISDDRSGAGSGERWLWRRRLRRCLGVDRPASQDSVSQPCHVVHISRTDIRHPNFRAAFAHLLPPPPSSSTTEVTSTPADCPATATLESLEIEEEHFRPRLPTR